MLPVVTANLDVAINFERRFNLSTSLADLQCGVQDSEMLEPVSLLRTGLLVVRMRCVKPRACHDVWCLLPVYWLLVVRMRCVKSRAWIRLSPCGSGHGVDVWHRLRVWSLLLFKATRACINMIYGHACRQQPSLVAHRSVLSRRQTSRSSKPWACHSPRAYRSACTIDRQIPPACTTPNNRVHVIGQKAST